MIEFELKLEIPPSSLPPLIAAMGRGDVVRQRLRATYFDTQDGALAARGVVVRMRHEGRQWVQTAKAPGSSPLARLEHNVQVEAEPDGTRPVVDL
ncbi:MAG: CYTH domain-containing protein, partial [Bdellovibrionales bacterium]|nr:CYTH domain-containing protein [Ramlibacter sp.]